MIRKWRDPEYGGYYDPIDAQASSITVMEDGQELFTGLYDAEGKPLYRERNKIGFI